MEQETKDDQPANVKKFFAIMSKSTRKELCKMHSVLTTFLEEIPSSDSKQVSTVAPATTAAHLTAKTA